MNTPLPAIIVILGCIGLLSWSSVLKHGYRVKRARPLPKSKQVSKVTRREWRRLYNIYMKSEAWKRKREEAFAYYGRRCGKCGTRYDLHIHHHEYPPPHLFGTEDVKTLAVWCKDCHEAHHGHKIGR